MPLSERLQCAPEIRLREILARAITFNSHYGHHAMWNIEIAVEPDPGDGVLQSGCAVSDLTLA